MGRKQLAWFVHNWLAFFEAKSTSYNYQKGKKDHLQRNIRFLEITKGMLQATVKGLDTYHVKIVSKHLSIDSAVMLEKIISQNPIKLMKIYQGTLKEEDVVHDPFYLGFDFRGVEIHCTCGQPSPFCSHSIAAALYAADRFNDDFCQFLIFNGLDLKSILLHVGGSTTDWNEEKFTLLPVPEGSIRSFDHRIGGTPDFWTSSFPFMRMLEEILQKIREEGKKIGT